ncbi:MAG: hypothetical protein WC501_02355 [Candidatus Micrarchaeia archaeon]
MKKNFFGIVILFAVIFFMFGCTSQDIQKYYAKTGASDYRADLILSPVSTDCTCFICEKGSFPAPWPFNLLLDYSLEGGNCGFYENCNSDSVVTYLNANKEPKSFMLGMGPRPWDFTYGNTYCNNSLDFAVHWLVSDNNEYEFVPKSEAVCYLQRNIVPVYILYSNGTAINLESSEKIAKELSGAGPVIIVAEIDFDSSNPQIIQKVGEQIINLKQNCPTCIIAAGPRMNDYEGLEKLLSDPTVNNSVDMIAFGANSNHFDSSRCTIPSLYYEAIQFSKYAWFNQSKPVLWPYILVDTSKPSKSECFFSEYEKNNAYYEFFSTVMPAAISSGVIGAAPYLFYSAGLPTDPLDCENCGLINIEDGKLTPNEPLFSSWFYGCRSYLSRPNPLLITLPKEKGTVCNFGFTGDTFLNFLTTTGLAEEHYVATDDTSPLILSCLGCVDECLREDCAAEGDFDCKNCELDPYGLKDVQVAIGEKCDYFEELDLWASLRGLDPAFVRATAWAESGLNTANPDASYCALSFVNKTNGWNNCNALDVLYIVDPRQAIEGEHSCADYFDLNYFSEIERTNSNQDLNDDKKPCSFGLMQINPDAWASYPYPYWSSAFFWPLSDLNTDQYAVDVPALQSIYEEDSKKRLIAESCAEGGYFNPFNGNDNACYGTWILKEAWKNAESFVNTNSNLLNAQTSIEKKWLTSFIAHYYYYGVSDNTVAEWTMSFYSRRTLTDTGCENADENTACCLDGKAVTSACCNNDDNFIQFVACCMDYDPAQYPTGYCGSIPEKDRTFLSIPEKYGNLGFERLRKQYSLSVECENKYLCGNLPLQEGNIDLFKLNLQN